MRLDECEIAAQAFLVHESLAVDDARLFSGGNLGAVGRRRKEAGDPRAARTQTLGERPLRNDLDFDVALGVFTVKMVGAGLLRKRCDQLADPAVLEQ